MLTAPGDLVLDIFGGSNTTGQVAEAERRRWMSFELSREYVAASAFRFLTKDNAVEEMIEVYERIGSGKFTDIREWTIQEDLLAVAGE